MFLVGQSVSFETRQGSDEGLKGNGRVVSVEPAKVTIGYSYTVDTGPFAGEEIESLVECLETEVARLPDYKLQVWNDETETWKTLVGKFHEDDARRWIEIIGKFTGEQAIMWFQ